MITEESPQKFYDDYYRKNPKAIYSDSLLKFFNESVDSRLRSSSTILDLGAGAYSFFEDTHNLKAEVTALDFSHQAIAQAAKSSITYLHGSVTDSQFFPELAYDLVFDSHCLHCVIDIKERALAFKNIFLSLKEDGIFASEFMVQPIGRYVEIPYKIIKTARELEEEILSYGFKINYFMIVRDNVFESIVDGEEVKCDVLRVIARK